MPYGTMSAVELSLTSIMDKVYVDDWGQCQAGHVRRAAGARRPRARRREETIAGELADVVAGTRPGRERDDERILFWHRGLATTDIALGQAILDRAVEQRRRHAAALPLILRAAAGAGTVRSWRRCRQSLPGSPSSG